MGRYIVMFIYLKSIYHTSQLLLLYVGVSYEYVPTLEEKKSKKRIILSSIWPQVRTSTTTCHMERDLIQNMWYMGLQTDLLCFYNSAFKCIISLLFLLRIVALLFGTWYRSNNDVWEDISFTKNENNIIVV
jgi:hypothetical protein